MTTDSMLLENIELELDFEPSLDAAGIGVIVNNGIATLSGHVSSFNQKVAAERAAGRVKGIRGLAEELEVRLPVGVQHHDRDIASCAANVLDWVAHIPADTVHVKVEKGWITLTGDVDWQYQRLSAESAVRAPNGVVGVTNLIKIRPHITSGDVRSHIAQAYERNAQLESSDIRISVDGSEVTLSGSVKSWNDRRVAENAAWAVRSVTHVVDNLTVA